MDPWSGLGLNSDSGSGTGSDKRKQEVPFYVSQYKTSAEIIEEAKANINMTKQGAFPAIRYMLVSCMKNCKVLH